VASSSSDIFVAIAHLDLRETQSVQIWMTCFRVAASFTDLVGRQFP